MFRAQVPDRYYFLVSAILALHGWTAVQHIPPWTAYYNEWPFFVALLLLVWPIARLDTSAWQLSWVLVWPWILALLPLAQFVGGVVVFFGDAAMAALYLACFGFACGAGCRLDLIHKDLFVRGVATTILAGALISLVLAAQQWLRVDLFGIWLVDMAANGRPYANLAQPNNLATLLCLGLAAVLYLHETGQLRRIFFHCTALLLIAGIAMTRSRSAMLTLTAALIWFMFWRNRLVLRTRTAEITLGFVIYVVLWTAWPTISGLLGSHAESRIAQTMGGDVRLVIWTELLDAAFQRPWMGWGWNEVSLAQVAVAANYPQSALVEHAHNILIDLLLWNGVVLGGVIVIALIFWGISRARHLNSLESWFGMLVVIIVGTHAMLELPAEYSYFLFPLGLCVGIIENRHPNPLTIRLPSPLIKMAILLMCLVSITVACEYKIVESDYRQMRFEGAGIERRPETPAAPNVIFLTHLREYIRFARTQAQDEMSSDSLEWMNKVAHRFPFPPVLLRNALALSLNHRPEEAAIELKRLCRLHPQNQCSEAIENLNIVAERHREVKKALVNFAEISD